MVKAINDVLLVSNLKKKLFSESVVTGEGLKIGKQDSHEKILEKSGFVDSAVKDYDSIYKLMFRTVIDSTNVVTWSFNS